MYSTNKTEMPLSELQRSVRADVAFLDWLLAPVYHGMHNTQHTRVHYKCEVWGCASHAYIPTHAAFGHMRKYSGIITAGSKPSLVCAYDALVRWSAQSLLCHTLLFKSSRLHLIPKPGDGWIPLQTAFLGFFLAAMNNCHLPVSALCFSTFQPHVTAHN